MSFVVETLRWLRRYFYWAFQKRGQFVYLEYSVNTSPRYSPETLPHPELLALFSSQHMNFKSLLVDFAPYVESMAKFVPNPDNALVPSFHSSHMPAFDAITLYCMIRKFQPQRVIEIGSGMSTYFMRAAIDDEGLSTHLTCIDPMPRRDISKMAHHIRASRLEETDLTFVETLEAGDVVFFDGSHRSFTNSDVTVFFMEVLPRLKPGVIVQIHDVFLPFDYHERWKHRFYSEQYLLACWLLAGRQKIETLLPVYYVSTTRELRDGFQPFIRMLGEKVNEIDLEGGSFWLRIL